MNTDISTNNNLSSEELFNLAIKITNDVQFNKKLSEHEIGYIFSNFINFFKEKTVSSEYSTSLDNSLNGFLNPLSYADLIHNLDNSTNNSFVIAPIMTKTTLSSCVINKDAENNFNIVFSKKLDNGSYEYISYTIPQNNINKIIDCLGYNNSTSIDDFSSILMENSSSSKKVNNETIDLAKFNNYIFPTKSKDTQVNFANFLDVVDLCKLNIIDDTIDNFLDLDTSSNNSEKMNIKLSELGKILSLIDYDKIKIDTNNEKLLLDILNFSRLEFNKAKITEKSPFAALEASLNYTFEKENNTEKIIGPIISSDIYDYFIDNILDSIKDNMPDVDIEALENQLYTFADSLLTNKEIDNINTFTKKSKKTQNNTKTINRVFELENKLYVYNLINKIHDISKLKDTIEHFNDLETSKKESIIKYNDINDIKQAFYELYITNPIKKELQNLSFQTIKENYFAILTFCDNNKFENYSQSLKTLYEFNNIFEQNIIPSFQSFNSQFLMQIRNTFPLALNNFINKYPNHLLNMAYDTSIKYPENPEYAETIYNLLVENNPLCSQFLVERGKFYVSKGDYEKASSDFKKAYSCNPNSIDTKQYYASYLAYKNDTVSAINLCKEILNTTPNNFFINKLLDNLSSNTFTNSPDIIFDFTNYNNIKNLENLSYENLMDQILQIDNVVPYILDFDKKNMVAGFSNLVNIYKKNINSAEFSKSLSNSLDYISKPLNYSFYANNLDINSTDSFIIAPVFSLPTPSSCIIYKSDNNLYKVIFSKKTDSNLHDYTEYYIPSNNLNKIISYLGYCNKQDFSANDLDIELELSSVASKKITIDSSEIDFVGTSPFTEFESTLMYTYTNAFSDDKNILKGPISVNDTHKEFQNTLKHLPISDNTLKSQLNTTIDLCYDSYLYNSNLSRTIFNEFHSDNIYKFLSNSFAELPLDLINNLKIENINNIPPEMVESIIYNNLSYFKNHLNSILDFDNKEVLKKQLSLLNEKNLLDNCYFFTNICNDLEPEYGEALVYLKMYYDNLNSDNLVPDIEAFKEDMINCKANELFPYVVDSLYRSYYPYWIDTAYKALELNDYTLTETTYDTLISRYPNNANLLLQRGKFYSLIGKFKEASIDFKNATLLEPNSIEIKQHYAIALACSECNDLANSLCKNLLEIDPKNKKTNQLNELLTSIKPPLDVQKIYAQSMQIIDNNSSSNIDENVQPSTLKRSNSTFELYKSDEFNNITRKNSKLDYNNILYNLTPKQQENQILQILGYSDVPSNIDKSEAIAYFYNIRNIFINKIKDSTDMNVLLPLTTSLNNSLSCLSNPNDYSSVLKSLKELSKKTNYKKNFIIAPVFHYSGLSNVIIYPSNDNNYEIVVIDNIGTSQYRYISYTVDSNDIESITSFLGYGANYLSSKESFFNLLENICSHKIERPYYTDLAYSNNSFSCIEHAVNFAYCNSIKSSEIDQILNCLEYLLDFDNVLPYEKLSQEILNTYKKLPRKELLKIYNNYLKENNVITEVIKTHDVLSNQINTVIDNTPDIVEDISDYIEIYVSNINFRDMLNKNRDENDEIPFKKAEQIFKSFFPYSSENELIEHFNKLDYYTLKENYSFFAMLCKKNNFTETLKRLEHMKILFNTISQLKFIDKSNNFELLNNINFDSGNTVFEISLAKLIKECEPYFSAASYTLGDKYCNLILNISNKAIDLNSNENSVLNLYNTIITALDTAIDIMPNNAYCYSKKGLYYTLTNNDLNSETYFLKALNLEPNNLSIRQEYLNSLLISGKQKEALLESNKILSLDPNFTPANEVKKYISNPDNYFNNVSYNDILSPNSPDLKTAYSYNNFEHYKDLSENKDTLISDYSNDIHTYFDNIIDNALAKINEKSTIASTNLDNSSTLNKNSINTNEPDLNNTKPNSNLINKQNNKILTKIRESLNSISNAIEISKDNNDIVNGNDFTNIGIGNKLLNNLYNPNTNVSKTDKKAENFKNNKPNNPEIPIK